MSNEPHGDGAEPEFSRPELIALAIGGISIQLSLRLAEARDLLAAAHRLDASRSSRPAAIQRAARDLSGQARRRAERAAEQVADDVASYLQGVFTGGEDGIPSSQGRNDRYPLAPEQVFLTALVGIGPVGLRGLVENFTHECGNDSGTLDYAVHYMQWMHRDPPTTIMGRALLPILIADFEDFLAALVRLWVTLYPEAHGISGYQVTVGVIEQYESIDDIRRLATEAKVDTFMKLSCEQWRRELASKLRIQLGDLTSDWSGVVEIFARRHAIVHAGGRVDEQYLSRLSGTAPRPPRGAPLCTDRSYICTAIDRVEQLADGLTVAWLEHFLPAGDSCVPEMALPMVLRALEQGRWHDAATLATIALKGSGMDHPHHELRVNFWMARRELGEDWERLQNEITAWSPPPREPRYLVAKAALLRDELRLLDELRSYQSAGLSVRELRTWPLLIQMRKSSTQVAAFLDAASATPTKQRPHRRPRGKRV